MVAAAAHQSDEAVRIADVEYRWPGSGFALHVPALEIARGSRAVLLGPSGGGKSTLLSLIAGVLKPDAGVLEVLSRDLAAARGAERDAFRAEHIGVIFQQFNLLPYGSVLDNITLPLSFAPCRRARAVSQSGSVEADVKRLMAALDLGGISTARRAAELSVGQQQRVAVARALIGGPELVIADEPTSALDSDASGRFLE
ncbi:MAG: ATP-binding cassette domain-containing protein, partial [Pseudomonadota bacterium]